MQLMKQRKMYDNQLAQLMDMEFNMSNLQMATDQIEMTKQVRLHERRRRSHARCAGPRCRSN
jgi:hypothetical protein|eukprot:SAG25_NODE_1686_length_2554_cov_1.591039_3_plen_62_part_00